jgi:hypothetical protein
MKQVKRNGKTLNLAATEGVNGKDPEKVGLVSLFIKTTQGIENFKIYIDKTSEISMH